MASIEQGSLNLTSGTIIGVNILPYTILGNNAQVVTLAGTRVQLGSSSTVKTVTVRANASNTGLIYVGTVTVTSANGFQLSAGETVSLDIDSTAKIYIDSQVNGEGVTYITLE